MRSGSALQRAEAFFSVRYCKKSKNTVSCMKEKRKDGAVRERRERQIPEEEIRWTI